MFQKNDCTHYLADNEENVIVFGGFVTEDKLSTFHTSEFFNKNKGVSVASRHVLFSFSKFLSID